MKKLIGLLVFCSLVLQVNAQKESIDTTEFRILTYGFPNGTDHNARMVIQRKWKIYSWAVAGCSVTEQLVDSVKQYNDSVYPLIVKKYGADWEERFEAEIVALNDFMYTIEKSVMALANVVEKNEELHKEGNGFHCYIKPSRDANTYTISIEGWAKIDGKYSWSRYYIYSYDDKTKSFTLVDDTLKVVR